MEFPEITTSTGAKSGEIPTFNTVLVILVVFGCEIGRDRGLPIALPIAEGLL